MIPSKVLMACLIATSAGLFIWANVLSLRWGKSGEPYIFLLFTVVACFAYAIFGKLSSERGVAITSGLVDSSILIGTVMIGVLFLGEALNIRQIFGLCFALLGLVLLF